MIIIYSETTAIAESVEQNWLEFMEKNQIPALMKTGLFLDFRFVRIPESEGVDRSYNLQLRCENIKKFNEFKAFHENKFKQAVANKFQGNFGSFHSTLEQLIDG